MLKVKVNDNFRVFFVVYFYFYNVEALLKAIKS